MNFVIYKLYNNLLMSSMYWSLVFRSRSFNFHTLQMVVELLSVFWSDGSRGLKSHFFRICGCLVRSHKEQHSEVQLRNVVEYCQCQHCEGETNQQVSCCCHFVERTIRLIGKVARYVISQTHRCQRYEAVVEGVQIVPFRFEVGEYAGGEKVEQ